MGKWSIIGGVSAQVFGAAMTASGYGAGAGAAVSSAGQCACNTAGAVKDAKVEKQAAKEKELKEKQAQELTAANERLRVTAGSFGASALSEYSPASTPTPARSRTAPRTA